MPMTRSFASLIATLVLTVPAFAQEGSQPAAPKAPDLAKGQAIATQICSACHGPDGNAVSDAFPKLAGQHAGYIVKQLSNFKSGERVNAVMGPYAAALSEDDMKNVAAYFESQTLKPDVAHDKATIERGQKIFRGGIAETGVPACAACHGPDGAGIPVQYPRIGGQWDKYTYTQLAAFHSGERKNSEPMMTIAGRLSDADMKAVSDYIAGLR